MKKRIPTDGSNNELSINDAFASLNLKDLPQANLNPKRKSADSKPSQSEKLGKVHMAIEKSGRSGKTVTVLFGPGIANLTEERLQDLLASLKRKFACGGTLEDGKIELQGELRDRVKLFLQMLGFSA